MALPLGLSAQSLPLDDETSGLIRRAVEDGTIPGAVVRIEQDGRKLADAAAGWRDIENRSPMTADTIFDVRSITKPVTAIAALLLVAEGNLSLDGAVEEHIPEVASLRARAPITLRHLLTHTAGLVHERPPELQDLTEKRDCTLEDVVSILTQGQLIGQPGERWSYSSQGFAIAGRIVEVLSRQPFHRYVEDRVLRPLGMRDSFFHPTPRSRARLANLYSWDKDKGRLKRWPRTLPADRWEYDSPDFGLYSTAADITRLLRSMFPGSRGVLSPSLTEQMLVPHIEAELPGLFQGLGWFVARDEGLCEPLGVKPGCFGANGAGGSMAWANPARQRTAVYFQQVFFGSEATGPRVIRSALC